MKVAVTGGLGFIGSKLPYTQDIVRIDNLSSNMIEPGEDDLTADVSDPMDRRVDAVIESSDVVVHMAALAGVDACKNNVALSTVINIIGTTSIAIKCVRHNKPLVFISSAAVEGESLYGAQKKTGECMVRDLLGDNAVSLRLYNVVSEDQPTTYNPVVPNILKSKKYGDQMIVTGDGEQRRDFIHVEDVADLIMKVAEALADGGRTFAPVYDVGTGRSNSINELCAKAGVSPVYIEDADPGLLYSIAETATWTKNDFGWDPQRSVLDLL